MLLRSYEEFLQRRKEREKLKKFIDYYREHLVEYIEKYFNCKFPVWQKKILWVLGRRSGKLSPFIPMGMRKVRIR